MNSVKRANVFVTRHCEEQFEVDYKNGLFSQDDGNVIKSWQFEMECFGSKYISRSIQWNDHPLYDDWSGYRASSFSKSGRIIYRIIDDKRVEIELIEVEKITPDHDYAR